MMLETAFANGQLDALRRHKLGWPAATDPTVAGSAVLQGQAAKPMSSTAQQNMQPPTTPHQLAQVFDAHEQGKTRTEPRRKLSADGLCTSCRQVKHYGPCRTPRKIPAKAADFNMGLLGSDPSTGDNPSTSPHYHSATSDSALARTRDGRPADEQAGSAFADLYRHLGITSVADEPGRMTGGLNKVAEVFNVAKYRARRVALLEKMFSVSKLGNFKMWGTDEHSAHEQRGPSVNPYEERRTRMGAPAGWGPEGAQRIDRMFREFDNPVDTTNVGGGFGDPEPGPAALG